MDALLNLEVSDGFGGIGSFVNVSRHRDSLLGNGLGAFLFARDLGCRESVALCAAAGWMYAGAMAFFVLWAIGGAW